MLYMCLRAPRPRRPVPHHMTASQQETPTNGTRDSRTSNSITKANSPGILKAGGVRVWVEWAWQNLR